MGQTAQVLKISEEARQIVEGWVQNEIVRLVFTPERLEPKKAKQVFVALVQAAHELEIPLSSAPFHVNVRHFHDWRAGNDLPSIERMSEIASAWLCKILTRRLTPTA